MKESINEVKTDLMEIVNVVTNRPYLTFLFGVFIGLGVAYRIILITIN
jgi:hypothetical protein